jgi:hypothetical protein
MHVKALLVRWETQQPCSRLLCPLVSTNFVISSENWYFEAPSIVKAHHTRDGTRLRSSPENSADSKILSVSETSAGLILTRHPRRNLAVRIHDGSNSYTSLTQKREGAWRNLLIVGCQESKVYWDSIHTT